MWLPLLVWQKRLVLDQRPKCIKTCSFLLFQVLLSWWTVYQNHPKVNENDVISMQKNALPALTGAKSAFFPPTRQNVFLDRCRPRPGHTLRGKHEFLITLTLKSSGSIRVVQIDGLSWALCSTTLSLSLRMPAAKRVNSIRETQCILKNT